jgi:hypothetical protein
MEEKKWVNLPFLSSNHYINNLGVLIIKSHMSTYFKKGTKVSRKIPFRTLRFCCNGKGYKRINFRGKTFYQHRLLAYAFLGLPEKSELEVNHIDGNKSNNSLENLELVTRLENVKHSLDTGLTPVGEKHYSSVLTLKQVKEIVNMRKEGCIIREIAEYFSVSQGCVKGIIYGYNWKSKE